MSCQILPFLLTLAHKISKVLHRYYCTIASVLLENSKHFGRGQNGRTQLWLRSESCSSSIKTMLQNHVWCWAQETTSGCDAGDGRYKHTHNIVHIYKTHRGGGVFIIIWLWRVVQMKLSAGGCAAAGAAVARTRDQTGVGEWVGGLVWVQAAKLVVPRCSERQGSLPLSATRRPLYWRPIDFISSGRLSHEWDYPPQQHSGPAAGTRTDKNARQCIVFLRAWCWSPNAHANVTFCDFFASMKLSVLICDDTWIATRAHTCFCCWWRW